jgi:hypothetical protein
MAVDPNMWYVIQLKKGRVRTVGIATSYGLDVSEFPV